MNPWRWVDPRVEQVKVVGVQAYFLSHGWALTPNPNRQLLRFDRAASRNDAPVFQMVPASETAGDFSQRIAELITTLSELEDRHPIAILDDILHADTEESNGRPERSRAIHTG